MRPNPLLAGPLLTSMLALTLTACGGGEGGSAPAPAAIVTPTADTSSAVSPPASATVVAPTDPTSTAPAPSSPATAAAPATEESLLKTVTTTVGDAVDKTVELVVSAATTAKATVIQIVEAASEALAPAVEAAVETAGSIADTVEAIVDNAAEALAPAVDAAAEAVTDVAEAIAEPATGGASPAVAMAEPAAAPEGVAALAPDTLDIFTTRSGHWRLVALPAQGDAAVYRMTLDENPAFVREFACRRAFTLEAGDGTAVNLATVTLLQTETKVAQGSCRVVQNMEPVAPNAEWIREAIAAGVIPSYKRERAWIAGLPSLARDPKRGAYDPTSLGPRTDGSTGAPTGNHNFVGVTSRQGGEYSASRGFLHNADARVVDAALHYEDSAIAAYWPEFVQYTLYSLAQPQGGVWSAVNHVTVDPQFPQAGDRAYELPFHNNPNPATDSMKSVDNWIRDVAHLENTGFIHWLATEDPIAGLVVQRQAAYALAGRYEYLRGGYSGSSVGADTAYEGQTAEERALFNTLSALWKSRDVSRRIGSLAGRMFWSAGRAERQANEVIAFYDKIAGRIDASTPAQPVDYLAKLSGTLFGAVIGIGSYDFADGSIVKLQQTSAFQAVQYGKEPLWLWTKAGNPAVRRWFTSYASGLSVRMSVIGGAMGVDGRTSRGGSGYPIGPTAVVNGTAVAAAPNFSTTSGWGEWVAALPLKKIDSRTTFDGAAIHTATQMEGALLMAKDAGLAVPELDTALGRVHSARAATTAIGYATLQMHKHLGAAPN